MQFSKALATLAISALCGTAFATQTYTDSTIDHQIGGASGLTIGSVTFATLSDVLVTLDLWTAPVAGYDLPSSLTIALRPNGGITSPLSSTGSATSKDPIFNLIDGTNYHYLAQFHAIAGNSYSIVATGNDGNNKLMFTNIGAQVTAVPEPETYAMLLSGLGMLGFVGRRRRQD